MHAGMGKGWRSRERSLTHYRGGGPGIALPVILLLLVFLVAPASGTVMVEYFHQPGCAYCIRTDPLMEGIGAQYGDRIALDTIRIDDREGVRLLMSYGVTEVPVVVINRNKVLSAAEITQERLDQEILLAESGAYPVPAARKNILVGDPLSALLVSFVLGLMTGLSPCLLGSLVLLIAGTGTHAADGRARYYPLAYGAGIVAAYLLIAGAILGAGAAFLPDAGSRPILYGIGGLVAILAGLVQLGLFSLPDRVSGYSSALVRRFHTLPGVFGAGILFAILFAPCAIAPFLILATTLLIDRTLVPVLMLFAFAAGILAPFAAFAAIRDTARERLLKYTGIVQKAGGILLIGFGVWLLIFA